MDSIPANLMTPLTQHLLSIADDKFILGHRNADWTGLAPILEEDIAFSSMAQDELSHASALYGFIAELTAGDANRLAYGRSPAEYRCAQLVERSDEFDWSVAIVRKFYFNHFDMLRLMRLTHTNYPPLAALAERMLAEARTHIPHADGWLVRLSHGPDDVRLRMQSALDHLAPLAVGLFEPVAGIEQLTHAGLIPADSPPLAQTWADALQNVVEEAGLRLVLPKFDLRSAGGRRGIHTPDFVELLDELTEVYRVEPQAAW